MFTSLRFRFFIGENIIVTNYHVIDGASEASCYTNNSSKRYIIEGFLAADKTADLILLKVAKLNRPSLKFATSRAVPGQKIYVLGSPKGLPSTISDGIVSGLRDFDGIKLIQITAPISPGSSGGPVLNSAGELIGISVGQFTEGQNLNFAIPKANLELLLNFKKQYTMPFASLVPVNKFILGDWKSTNPIKIGKIKIMGFDVLEPEGGLNEDDWNTEGVMYDHLEDGARAWASSFDYIFNKGVLKMKITFSSAGIQDGTEFFFFVKQLNNKMIELTYRDNKYIYTKD